jgi:hypothetical protein
MPTISESDINRALAAMRGLEAPIRGASAALRPVLTLPWERLLGMIAASPGDSHALVVGKRLLAYLVCGDTYAMSPLGKLEKGAPPPSPPMTCPACQRPRCTADGEIAYLHPHEVEEWDRLRRERQDAAIADQVASLQAQLASLQAQREALQDAPVPEVVHPSPEPLPSAPAPATKPTRTPNKPAAKAG